MVQVDLIAALCAGPAGPEHMNSDSTPHWYLSFLFHSSVVLVNIWIAWVAFLSYLVIEIGSRPPFLHHLSFCDFENHL